LDKSPHPAWTPARFKSFIISALRSASNRYPPKFECIKNARIERGKYKCKGYNRKAHVVTASVVVNKKRKKNIYADHIYPVVNPATGFQSWDEFISRLFVPASGFQALCLECHSQKSAEERSQRKKKE